MSNNYTVTIYNVEFRHDEVSIYASSALEAAEEFLRSVNVPYRPFQGHVIVAGAGFNDYLLEFQVLIK